MNIDNAGEREKDYIRGRKKAFEMRNFKNIEGLKTNESRAFYGSINRSRMDFKQTSNLRKGKDSLILAEKLAIFNSCEHFHEIFSNHDRTSISEIVFENQNSEEVPSPELEEIETAIKKLKINKTIGHTTRKACITVLLIKFLISDADGRENLMTGDTNDDLNNFSLKYFVPRVFSWSWRVEDFVQLGDVCG
ncbi:hypothetical protein HNY73_019955 [Argiope bruennichi]|uniref:Uncharacterized protein n=1 Tax=Argiope bruennichi TaxID=94029 RepID=A0A8T0E6I0_ARGBR|nr:hypothetical protein HNY73_019955 [Argiope bruennichi]